MALDRLEEALDCCDRCLSFDAHNQGVQTIRHQAVTAKMAKDRKEREKAVRLRKEEEARRQMSIAFKVTRHPFQHALAIELYPV